MTYCRTYRYATGFDRHTRPPDAEYGHSVMAHDFCRAAERAAEDVNVRTVSYPREQDIWLIDEATGEEQCHAVTLDASPVYTACRIEDCAP